MSVFFRDWIISCNSVDRRRSGPHPGIPRFGLGVWCRARTILCGLAGSADRLRLQTEVFPRMGRRFGGLWTRVQLCGSEMFPHVSDDRFGAVAVNQRLDVYA